MAFVADSLFAVFAFADNSGKVVTRRYECQDTDPAAVAALMDDWATTIEGVTDAEIVSYSLEQRWIEDAVTLPAAGVQNENQAIITSKIDGDPTESATVTIPAPKIGIFSAATGPGADVLDPSDTALGLFQALFLDGGAFYVSDGEFMSSVFSGRRRHVKNNRG